MCDLLDIQDICNTFDPLTLYWWSIFDRFWSIPKLTYINIDSYTLPLIHLLFSSPLSICSGCDLQQSGLSIHTWGAAHGPKCDPEVLASRRRFCHAGPPPSLLRGTPHLSALLTVFPAALAGKDKSMCLEGNTLESVIGWQWQRKASAGPSIASSTVCVCVCVVGMIMLLWFG